MFHRVGRQPELDDLIKRLELQLRLIRKLVSNSNPPDVCIISINISLLQPEHLQ